MFSSTRLLRTAAPTATRRLLHATPAVAANQPGKDPQLSQGTTGPKSNNNNRSPQDVLSQAAEDGYRASSGTPHDAASSSHMPGPDSRGTGNPEGVGMREQIGGASASADGSSPSAGRKGGEEEASAPGYIGRFKQMFGMSSSSDVKRDDRRSFHTSAVASAQQARADPESTRKPKDSTFGEQNAHLRHKQDGEPDTGKGNAAAEPTLPSQKTPQTRANAPSTPPSPKSTRTLYTSAVRRAPLGNPSADPEQQSPVVGEKEELDTKPLGSAQAAKEGMQEAASRAQGGSSTQTSQDAERKAARRPKHSYGTGSSSGRAEFHTSAVAARASGGGHSADSYFKDVDSSPSETPSVHKVDSSNDALNDDSGEHKTGPYHEAGVGSDEYKTVSREAPYDTPIPEEGEARGEKLRYGGTDKWDADKGKETSGPQDGPAEGNKEGRKPERA